VFGDWLYEQPKVPPFPPVRQQVHPGIFLAEKNDVTQTFFIEGHLAGELRDKDLPALEVMGDILGGGFQSRLMQRVRTQLGLAYEISATWGSNYDHPGLFEIGGSTKSSSTADTLKAVQDEIARIRSTEVTPDELETARQSALNSLVFAFDTKSKTLGRILNYEYYGYPKDFIDRYQKGLEAVTQADVLRGARDRVHPSDLTVVAVGRTTEFQKSLATLGLPVSSIDITTPEPTAEKPPGKTEAGSAADARKLLERAQEAVGGADKLAAVKDMVEVAEMRVDPSAGGVTMKRTDQWVAPTYFREDTILPFGTVVIYGDGKGGWMSTPQGQTPLGAAQLKPVQDKLLRLYFPLLLSDRLPGRTVTAAGDALDISDGQGNKVRLFIDEKTGMPAKIEYASENMGGPPSTIDEVFDAFEIINGVKVPKHMTVLQNGRKYADLVVQSVKLNSGLKPEELSRKP
jgi:zinc protease